MSGSEVLSASFWNIFQSPALVRPTLSARSWQETPLSVYSLRALQIFSGSVFMPLKFF
ncbi:MAG: hypothetical protein ACUVXA_10875 [Candidatus Jordarchaeum sp.]|uniref:hypothetical protein n=1 Tax=Candidatus Jordarchaeum sp. TaxID=2823881 RepID=UPI004049879B